MTSNYTHETVPTQFVEANGIRYAYRRFGRPGTIPLLFLEYFNSNMDGWDPDVTNSLAADHQVILFDNAGVDASGGKTPQTVAEMAKHCVAFCRALGLKQTHVVGFSLGGMIAQHLALEHPQLIGRLILLGPGPRGGEGMTFTELSPEEQADPVAFLLAAFFSPSEASQAAGREYMKRLESRKKDRDLPVSRDSAVAQVAALREWGTMDLTEAQVHAVIDPWYSQFTVATRGDVKAIWEKVVSPDYQTCSGYLPGDCLGRDAAIRLVGGLTTAIPDLKFQLKEVLISGDRVTVLGEFEGTPAGDLFDVPHSGKSFRIMTLDVQTIKDGKIVRTIHTENWLSALNQLRAK